ncbi:MAG TPA: hypothetical protein VK211_13335 [Kamptonema sp.]|nr:hypothetical protein [Kamptonema sp.]
MVNRSDMISVFLSDELILILQQYYSELSEIEKQAIAQLSNEN